MLETVFTTTLNILAILCFCACQPSTIIHSSNLPTLMALPTQTKTSTPQDTATPAITASITPSATITDTPTPTATPLPTYTATPEADAVVTGEQGANLRTGPGREFAPPLSLLPNGTLLSLVGQSADAKWYEVTTTDGQTGWVSASMIFPYIDPAPLPITYMLIPTPIPLVISASNNTLQVSGLVSSRVIQIYQDGLARGNAPLTFTKVGDSITANQPFMAPFASGKYDLGPYIYLEPSVTTFGPSMRKASMAASNAFNAAAVISHLWADKDRCLPNESPLVCEYRYSQPSMAVILLGSVDIQLYTADEYRTYMQEIVDTSIGYGVIPILTTFPNGANFHETEAEEFNAVLYQIAEHEQIPLIDLRTPALLLPDHGVKDDGFHLTGADYENIVFGRDEYTYALSLRDLLTLQMLDTLRRGIAS